MMTRSIAVMAAFTLAACSGGGSSDSTEEEAPSLVPFAEYRSLDYTIGGGGGPVSVSGAAAPRDAEISVIESGGTVTGVSVDAGPASFSIDVSNGDTVSQSGVFTTFTSQDGSVTGAADARFEYQAYGAWQKAADPTSGVFAVAAGGQRTPDVSVPQTGSASYSGNALGYWVDITGSAFTTRAAMSASVDFDAGEVSVATSNTRNTPISGGPTLGAAQLDLDGTATLSGAEFEGRISAPIGGGIKGRMSGALFGPNAEELAGTGELSGVPGTYIVSFGGSQ